MTFRTPCTLLLLLLAACAAAPTRIERVQAMRAARERGDHEIALVYLADDPRMWFETREGPGIPWRLDGPWSGWDRYFRSTSELGPWEEVGSAVSVVALESNGFYRLIDRAPRPVRLTWFFDGDERISGFLVQAVPGERPPDRLDEFRAWAERAAPEELAYLMPEGRIDPGGDRPRRFHALLARWRAEVGLPPVEL